jgi:ATP-dependent helicase/nuclease subunit B
MFKFVEKLYVYSKELTISLTQITNKEDRDVEIFLINENTQNKLMEMARGQAKLITTHYKQKDKRKDIEHLERELYSYPLIPYEEKEENIKIRAFKNVYEELDYLCIDILKLVQEEGYRFRDITVVTNDLGSYEFLVKVSLFSWMLKGK